MLKKTTRIDKVGGKICKSVESNTLAENCENLTKSKNSTKLNYIACGSDFLTFNTKAAFI